MSDYLGFYIASGFPPLPQRERVEIIGFIHCDGWPRSGRGIPFQNHTIVTGDRFTVEQLTGIVGRPPEGTHFNTVLCREFSVASFQDATLRNLLKDWNRERG